MLKKLLFLGCFLSLFSSLNAQTTLSAGDIAIVGLNYDSVPYEMAIVNLVPISSGTVIRITDYAYDETTSAFSTVSTGNTSEGSIQWTTTSALAAGTVTKFTINAASGTPVVTGLPGSVSVIGWTNTVTTACPSAAGGDNWFIFQGPNATTVTTYVFAWCNPFALTHNTIPQVAGQFLVTGSGLSNIFNSYLPPSLTLGTNAISLSRDPASAGYHGDDNVYIGPKTGNKSSLMTDISTISNWIHNETTSYDINPGGTNFPGSNPVFTIPLGVEDFDISKLNFYPNPTSNILSIECSNTIDGIRVTNILGQEILENKTNNSTVQIDLSNLPKASYFVKVTSEGKEKTIKVIKQ
ncbi:T9SS type A sorting domain-containing protein [Flavobacterium sp.]|uniref:T9SS type A sorting domain-containing protein n=1 Tax=Flavobacterium sp. TaxID=239 RepID=UPI0037539018